MSALIKNISPNIQATPAVFIQPIKVAKAASVRVTAAGV
jgi:hypothetical protein